MRLWTLLVVLVVVGVAACDSSDQVGDPGDLVPSSTETTQVVPSTTTTTAASSSTAAAAPTTTAAATTSTPITVPASSTTTVAAPQLPPFFRYGSFGAIEVTSGGEIQLVDEPVTSVWSDGAGGLLFSYHWLSEVPGIWRLPSGASEPVVYPAGGSGGFINLDGRLAVMRFDDAEDWCPHPIRVHDLETGDPEDFVVCAGDGDYGLFPSSYGGGLFVGVDHFDSGSCRTNICVTLWDSSGGEIDIPANPYPCPAVWDEFPDWTPCELGAHVSPDGRLLAYRFRPDNKWPCPEYDDVPYEDWLEGSRNIQGEVVVLDLGTGAEVFRADSPAEERLADFDGRFLVLTTADRPDDVPLVWHQHDWSHESRIVDITAANPDHSVDGRVRLIWTATG
jgi:hypothetical protein